MQIQVSTKYFTQRFSRNIAGGIRVLEDEARSRYKQAADDVAKEWGSAVRASGRGGRHNSLMSDIKGQVTDTARGNFFIRIGWLGSAPRAADGKRTWFAYQDTGYHMFGGPRWIPGLLLQNDARLELRNRIRDINYDIGLRVKQEMRRR